MLGMWRAWGVVLLLFSQESDRPFTSEDHEFSIRPPAAWSRHPAMKPGVVKFMPPGKPAIPCAIDVIHARGSPEPLAGIVARSREMVAKTYPGAAATEVTPLVFSGRPAAQFTFTHAGKFHIKTLIHRTNIDYYMVDAQMGAEESPKYREAAEKCIASFEIVPEPLDDAARAARVRFLGHLKSAKIAPELLGEQWHAIHLGAVRTGRQRTQVSEKGGRYLFEIDSTNEFGEGGRDSTLTRGSFSPDGSFQELEFEQTKADATRKLQFRASVRVEGGRVRAARDMNGHKEERTFEAEAGTLLHDIGDIVRRTLLAGGKGLHLMRLLSPFADEAATDLVEVNDREVMELDGRKSEVHVVFSRFRRKNLVYYYAPDRTLLRFGGPREPFSMRRVSKEEALK